MFLLCKFPRSFKLLHFVHVCLIPVSTDGPDFVNWMLDDERCTSAFVNMLINICV
jgi:hypothetical protein